jgi:hypothetical protein
MYYSGSEYSGTTKLFLVEKPQSTHRVVLSTFWRAFHHDGKINPGWCGWGVHAHPLLLYLKSRTKLQCMLQLSRQIHSTYFYSTSICTLWLKHRTELDGRNQDGGNIHKKVFFLHGRGFSFCSRGWVRA